MERTLQQTLADTTNLLTSAGLQHALIGGLAASIRGRTRVTEDVDLVVHCDLDDAMTLLQSLDAFALEPLFPAAEEVVRRSYILPLRHQRTGVPIDLAIGVSGFEQQVVQRATAVTIESMQIHVATAEDLLLMKVLAGRPQDDQDIKGILQAQAAKLDWEYCGAVAQQLQEALGMDIAVRVQELKARVT